MPKLLERPIAIRHFLQRLAYYWPPAVLPHTPHFPGYGPDDRLDRVRHEENKSRTHVETRDQVWQLRYLPPCLHNFKKLLLTEKSNKGNVMKEKQVSRITV
jgi:hypothetical protein